MQVIQITSLTGHSPYDITICDITNTYCYIGAIGVTMVPLTINIPTELLGTSELLVVVTDSIGCETFQPFYCPTMTPTVTPTPTPTITPTNISCNCITFVNPTRGVLNYSFINCYGNLQSFTIMGHTVLYVCGKSPNIDILGSYTIGEPCIGNTCPLPTPTMTLTPTPTPTIT